MTIRCAVLGSPISHSLSPTLHMRAYRELGIQGSYTAIDVPSGHLEKFISALDESWTGFSLTMPLKEEVLAIASDVGSLAQQTNSANTLIRNPRGWQAESTDVPGFVDALSAAGFSKFSTIAILGSGATARSAVAAFDNAGVAITVIHRSSQREPHMAAAAKKANLNFLPWGSKIPDVDLLINTTPSRVADVYASNIVAHGVFFEALYNPWPTQLLTSWRQNGGESVDGLDLLVHQGLYQIELMTGQVIDHKSLWPILRLAGLEAMNK